MLNFGSSAHITVHFSYWQMNSLAVQIRSLFPACGCATSLRLVEKYISKEYIVFIFSAFIIRDSVCHSSFIFSVMTYMI